MLPTLVRLGSVSISSLAVLAIVALFGGCYIFWRRLREMGVDEERSLEIFLIGLVFGLVFGRFVYILVHLGTFTLYLYRWFSFRTYPGFSLWGLGVGFLTSLWLTTRRSKLNFWRLADEAVFPLLFIGTLLSLGSFLAGLEKGAETSFFWGLFFPGDMICRHPVSLIRAWGLVMIWGWARWAEKRWRLWRWYPSHKEGFLVLLVAILVCMFEVLLAFLKPGGVYSWIIAQLLVFVLGAGAVVVFCRRSGRWRRTGKHQSKGWLKRKKIK